MSKAKTKTREGGDATQIEELLLQALETEMGGVKIYETALRCASNEDLREEWEKYLQQTRRHVEIVTELCTALDVDPDRDTPGRAIVRSIGEGLVHAMEGGLEAGEPASAQLVAAECVVLAETKDHHNWGLIGELAKTLDGSQREAVAAAHEEVEEQEDEHLYHTAGWARELWLESLGLKAVLPPPEERKHVKSAIGAERAKHQRGDMA